MSSIPTHGGISENLILPTETRSDFDSLLQSLITDYRPEALQQILFIEQLAIAHWYLWRRQRACNAIEAATYSEAGGEPESLTESNFRRLSLAEHCRTAAERALKRAFQNAESFRKDRQGQQDRLTRQAKWQGEQEIRERRIALQEQKQKATAEKAPPKSANPELGPEIKWGSDAWKKAKAEAKLNPQLTA